ncbi:MAG TPA: hypothetical protein VMV22_09965 [Acidimicrobiales bacterium]|nr:hypothetical protein [Acidimicrobiales bacterium]
MAGELEVGGLDACLAYGEAALAVMGVQEAKTRSGATTGPVAVAFDELLLAHDQLRELFAGGATSAVGELALSVLVLAERTRILVDS